MCERNRERDQNPAQPAVDIAVGSDHAGYKLRQFICEKLRERNLSFHDLGCDKPESCDYPDFADRVSAGIQSGEFNRGILICGTGIGMSIAANRRKGVRATVCTDEFTAGVVREHNNSNILCLGERTTPPEVAEKILDIWLTTEFDGGGRHQRRVDKLDQNGCGCSK